MRIIYSIHKTNIDWPLQNFETRTSNSNDSFNMYANKDNAPRFIRFYFI
jgi:hypothetical protein